MNKKNIIAIILLTILSLLMIVLITPQEGLFGSNTDWFNQHVNIADYLRKTMVTNQTIFPDYAFNLGGGQNIYHLSYYGLFRLDVLIGCLLLPVAMKDILISYMIINLLLSVILMYWFLKINHFNYSYSFLGAILLLTSTVLFHSHRQIMFVDYLPGLLLGLIAIDQGLNTRYRYLFIGSFIYVMINSYFFAVAGIVCLFTYYWYRQQTLSLTKLIIFIKPLIISIMISAILWLPTAYVLLESHSKSATSLNILTLFLPRLDFKGLLYHNYGCGLTYLCWIGLVLALSLKEVKKLTIWLLLVLFIPVFSYILNGFLYARTKCLIVFIPLIIYITIYAITTYHQKQLKLNMKQLILMILPGFIFIKEPYLMIDILLSIIFIIIYLKVNKQTVYCLMISPLLISYQSNLSESFVLKSTYYDVISSSDINADNQYRYDNFFEALNTCNLVNNNELKTTIYSSINNNLYNQFYYDIMKNPISIRNRVASLADSNIFFQGLMGVKTIYSKDIVPVGYKQIDDNLYQNDDVLPLVYATNDIYDLSAFNDLAFPATLDTIYNNVIVADGKKDYQSQIKPITLDYQIEKQSDNLEIITINNGYRINSKKTSTLELSLQKTGEILIIEFDLDKIKNQKEQDTVITINGITNKLSSLKAPYPNNNNHFTYIISQNDLIDKLQIKFSSGRYDIKNINAYTLDYDAIKYRRQQVDCLQGVYNQNNVLVSGSIDVSNDGYLVTSLPYQNGYTIKIDGQQVPIECVNTAFIGCRILKGLHQVEITFKAPLKNIGLTISGLGIILMIVMIRSKHE